jgi:hypothetical protein
MVEDKEEWHPSALDPYRSQLSFAPPQFIWAAHRAHQKSRCAQPFR